MNTSSLLEQELAPLTAQIEQVRGTLSQLEYELQAVEAELAAYAADRQRFDLLRDTCNLLDQLDELEAGSLFWGGLAESTDRAGHLAQVRTRIAGFDGEIRGVLERQSNLKAQANRRADELEYLYEEVRNAYARDERREEEFAIERELSPVPDHQVIMPWCEDAESDRRYRRTRNSALLLSLLLAIIIRMVTVPAPVRPAVVRIPERLAMMVRKEYKKPEPVKKPKEEKKDKKQEEKPADKKVAKTEEKKETAKVTPKPQEKPTHEQAQQAAPEPRTTPKKAESAGVLAFKESFRDLIDEASVPKLGNEASLRNTSRAGQALASRSLVAMQAGGRSGSGSGIANAAFSRNVGSGGIGSAGFSRSGNGDGNATRLGRGGAGVAQVKSGIAGSGAKDGTGLKEGKPLTSGARAARTDEEIQILFDRYKAALYRIYNTELRKNPTLRGKMVLRLCIEPGGEVSACAVESSNMEAPQFTAQIVERVRKFNFGPKEGVPKTTILYPIDFLPAR